MPSNVKLLAGASGGEPTDANFKNVTLLLHGDGSNGAQNNTFIDSSTNNFTITRNGNTTQGSFSPYGSNWSNYFDGSGDYISAPSNAALDCGTGDFTIECWVYISTRTNSYPLIFGNNRGSWTTDALALTNSNADSGGIYADRFVFGWNNGGFSSVSYGTSQLLVANATNSNNTWYHFAVVRNGTSIKMYRNGVEVASATISSGASFNWGYNGALVGGGNWDGAASYYNGYISNLRLLKGTALYTAAFTPPTQPLTAITNTSLLTCAYNRFRDGSTNNFTITRNGDVKVTNFAPFAPSSAYSTSANGGSAYFDGSGDYLSAPSNAAFAFGTGDFTLECWAYLDGNPGVITGIFDTRNSSSSSGGILCQIDQDFSNALRVEIGGSQVFLTSQTVPLRQWNHIAIIRSSGTVKAYLNGSAMTGGSAANSTNITDTNMRWGGDRYGYYVYGYISNARVVNGTAVYTANFTPPSSPVTAITNTSLLLNATNAAIFDNSMKNDLETVGNAQISTSVKKFGTGSMAFDGSGDSCRIAIDDPNLQFNTGNFTAEGWIYSTGGTGTYQHVLTGGTSWTTNSGGIYWYYNGGSPTLGAAWNHLPANPAVNSGTLAINTWHHFALVRNGNTLSLYINGTSVSTYSVSGYNLALNNQSRTNIGGGGWDNDFAGYIDDLRITKGVARYTANFTAPTAPFPNK